MGRLKLCALTGAVIFLAPSAGALAADYFPPPPVRETVDEAAATKASAVPVTKGRAKPKRSPGEPEAGMEPQPQA